MLQALPVLSWGPWPGGGRPACRPGCPLPRGTAPAAAAAVQQCLRDPVSLRTPLHPPEHFLYPAPAHPLHPPFLTPLRTKTAQRCLPQLRLAPAHPLDPPPAWPRRLLPHPWDLLCPVTTTAQQHCSTVGPWVWARAFCLAHSCVLTFFLARSLPPFCPPRMCHEREGCTSCPLSFFHEWRVTSVRTPSTAGAKPAARRAGRSARRGGAA